MKEYFSNYGTVVDIFMIRDVNTRKFFGRGIVKFAEPKMAAHCIERMRGKSFEGCGFLTINFERKRDDTQTYIYSKDGKEIGSGGKTIWSKHSKHPGPDFSKTNVHFTGLPIYQWEASEIKDYFSKFGTVTALRLKKDSRGGFVNFDKHEEAKRCIKALEDDGVFAQYAFANIYIPGGKNKKSKSNNCFKCGKSGHWARECPQGSEKSTFTKIPWSATFTEPALTKSSEIERKSQSICSTPSLPPPPPPKPPLPTAKPRRSHGS